MKLWTIRTLILFSLAVLLTACGGDDDDTDTSDTSTDTTTDATLDTAEDMATGPAIYTMTPGGTPCASCHGVSGMGDGVLADSYDPPPTNLTTYTGTAADIETAIRDGIGLMPANPSLTDAQIGELVTIVLGFSGR